MGAFFNSIHIRTENSDLVQKALDQVAKGSDCKFLLGPALNGWISVFPTDSGENDEICARIAGLVFNDIFHLIVHDDDIFIYFFYRDGRLVDEYNSNPNYPDEDTEEEKQECQGRPELFQDLLQPQALTKLKTVLAADTQREKFIFESKRMAQFVKLLGLSNALTTYDYLRAGDQDEDEIEGWKQFIHIEYQPASAEDYNHRGEVRLAKGDLDAALADFNKAIELNPNIVAARENCGRVERAKNERVETQSGTWSEFGSIKKTEGDLDGALVCYDKAIELNPEMAVAYNNRGGIKRAKGDLDGAMTDYNRAIELEPDLAVAYGNRGLVKKTKGDLIGALVDFDRAIELKTDSVQAYNSRGELKRAKGDWDGALLDFNRAIEIKPNFAAAYNNRGQVKRAKGDLDGALVDFDRAIELKSDSAKIYNNRGETKRIKGDLDSALADFNRAIELKPDFAVAYNNRGLVKRAKNDLDSASVDFNKSIELKPDLFAAFYNRGLVKQVKGDLDGALTDLNRAIELNPKLAQFYKMRGKLKESKGDLAGATADFNKAIELESGSAHA